MIHGSEPAIRNWAQPPLWSSQLAPPLHLHAEKCDISQEQGKLRGLEATGDSRFVRFRTGNGGRHGCGRDVPAENGLFGAGNVSGLRRRLVMGVHGRGL